MADRFSRRINYYETDRMGIVHHSNYIRYMEEARFDYMRESGVDYADVERRGVLMPVLNVSCRYKRSARFGDTLEIETRLEKFNGIRASYSYKFYFAGSDEVICEGSSEHCFVDMETRRPVNIKNRLKDYSDIMLEMVRGNNR